MSGKNNHLLEFLLRQGDNALVLGHRTSQWCGVGPALEEDIALANISLDLIGQTQLWLQYAAQVEGKNRTSNDLAYLREAYDFRNILMMEVPNEDFARTLMRQFLYDSFQVPWLTELQKSSNQQVSEIAAKSLKEALYHLDRSRETVIALGDGTKESNKRMQEAVEYLWPYTGEMFADDEIDEAMDTQGIAPVPSKIKFVWNLSVGRTFSQAFLRVPESKFAHSGGRTGFRHTEHLGHILATMQTLQRSFPGAKW